MTDDAEAIRALLTARHDAIATADARRAVATTVDGAVTYDLQPPLAHVHDRAAAMTGLNDWFATWAGPIAMTLHDPTVLVSGDLAVAYGLTQLRGMSRSAGAHESWFRDTIVFERHVAQWRIVHEHASYPTMMDGSGRAATDLTPV